MNVTIALTAVLGCAAVYSSMVVHDIFWECMLHASQSGLVKAIVMVLMLYIVIGGLIICSVIVLCHIIMYF